MRRTLLLTSICAGSFLFAQAPGGGGGGQTPQSMPSQRPSANNPMDTGNQNPIPSKIDDKKFLKDAALGGITEVELGNLAAQKASNADVKQFAQKMVDDHTKANDQLKQVATRNSIEVPAALDSKHQSRIDKLAKLSGEQFDKAYVKDQLKDHENDVREFQDEAQNGSDPNVKAFATTTLPTLQEHLEMVKNLKKSEK
jgi:putative membrane protein